MEITKIIDKRNNLNESLGSYAKWIKSISKCYILYDSIYVTLLKWENCRNGKQISGSNGLKGGGKNRREVGEPQTGITKDPCSNGNIDF